MAKKRRPGSEHHGIVLVDKPPGITSHDVVERIRRIYSTSRVGHTGTLDPQATGLLVMLLGEGTRISEYLMGADKSYEGTIQFGMMSDTYDADGNVEPVPGAVIPTDLEVVQAAAAKLTGELQQVPPPYSAKKFKGRKLYEYAREGAVPEVDGRPIQVYEFEILNLKDGISEFGIDCSSGTYVRSLVFELGKALGCGAILTELRRTDVGPFEMEAGRTVDQLADLGTEGKLGETVIPIQKALTMMPTVYLGPGAETWIRRGQSVPHNMVTTQNDLRPARGTLVVLCRLNGDAVAIARVDPAPLSPPPRAMGNAVPPWYQPVRQFEIEQPEESELTDGDE